MNTLAYVILLSNLIILPFDNKADNPEVLAVIKLETGLYERFRTPVAIDLKSFEAYDLSKLTLYEVRDGNRYEVITQITQKDNPQLHWQLDKRTHAGETLTYELINELSRIQAKKMTIQEDAGTYAFMQGTRPVLHYNAATVYPPEGQDEVYKRSGFIHPLFAPNGSVLTNIQPADHLHHYGIWNPWTKTTFRDREVDFWNLRKREGTVRHAGVEEVIEGSIFASLESLHEHIAWPESTLQVLAMKERNITQVFYFDEGMFLVEFAFHITPQEAITLEEFRYGGFVFRGTETWNNTTSDFITSEGLDRDNADGQRARWCVVTGDTSEGRAGILFMGHVHNFNHPEPLRIWPSDANRGNGDVFINFSPTRNTSWSLEEGTTYLLRYRLLVFAGEMDTQMAEKYWNDYANPPLITIEKK